MLIILNDICEYPVPAQGGVPQGQGNADVNFAIKYFLGLLDEQYFLLNVLFAFHHVNHIDAAGKFARGNRDHLRNAVLPAFAGNDGPSEEIDQADAIVRAGHYDVHPVPIFLY